MRMAWPILHLCKFLQDGPSRRIAGAGRLAASEDERSSTGGWSEMPVVGDRSLGVLVRRVGRSMVTSRQPHGQAVSGGEP